MRPLPLLLVVLAVIVIGARMMTGIVYARDAPIAALVLKPSPDFVIERTATAAAPVPAVVLDREEPRLVYTAAYVWTMAAAPVIAAALLVAAAVAARRPRV